MALGVHVLDVAYSSFRSDPGAADSNWVLLPVFLASGLALAGLTLGALSIKDSPSALRLSIALTVNLLALLISYPALAFLLSLLMAGQGDR